MSGDRRDSGHARDELLRAFQGAQERGRLAHAYLLLGASGIGKRTFARQLARQIVCPRAGAKGCDCLACRLTPADLAQGRHPDVHFVRAPEGKEIIPVELVRDELVRGVQLRSRGRQVFIVEEAHRLGPEAQNTTLKTLEEPGDGVHILLTTDSADSLLPTVRSRCHRVLVPPLSAAVVAGAHDLREDDPRVRIAAGSFTHLQQLLAEEAASLDDVPGLIEWIVGSAPPLQLAELLVREDTGTKLESQKAVVARLDLLGLVFRDSLVLASGLDEASLFLASHAPALRNLATQLGSLRLARATDAVHAAREAIQRYVDPTLAIHRLGVEVRR